MPPKKIKRKSSRQRLSTHLWWSSSKPSGQCWWKLDTNVQPYSSDWTCHAEWHDHADRLHKKGK